MQRANLSSRDVVYKTQHSLPDVFLSVFQERIRPDLVADLQNMLDSREYRHNHCLDASAESFAKLQSQIHDLKQIVVDSRAEQRRLEVRFNSVLTRSPRALIAVPSGSELDSAAGPERALISMHAPHQVVLNEQEPRRSLKEAYYLALLALGTFLKNLL